MISHPAPLSTLNEAGTSKVLWGRQNVNSPPGKIGGAKGMLPYTGDVPFVVLGEGASLLDTCKQVSEPVPVSGEIDADLRKWEIRRNRALKVAGAFRRLGMERRAGKIEACGWQYHRAVCRACGKAQNLTRSYHCGDRLCPTCSARRSGRMAGRWDRALKAFQAENRVHAYFFTVTFRDTENLLPFSQYARPRRLLFRHPTWKQYGLVGGVSAFETKLGKGSGSWHSHFHCVIYTRQEIPLIETGEHAGEFQNEVNQELSDVWRDLTDGESFIVKGMRFDGNTKELVKYMSKSPDTLPDAKLAELATWAKGKRFLSTFGACYNNPIMREAMAEGEEPSGLKRCECGCEDFELQLFGWHDRAGRFVLSSVRDIALKDYSPGEKDGVP